MKRNLKDFFAKLFRPSAHKMERRMKKGYNASAAVNLEEAGLNLNGDELAEYEKWLLKQPDNKQAN